MRVTSSITLSCLLAASLVPAAMAQTVAPAQSNSAPIVTVSPGASNGTPTTGTSPGTAATGTVITPGMSGAALSNAGNPNAPTNANTAVDTSGAKPMTMPAKGANSFTEEQAKGRLANNGFTDISTLTKDENGVWRGRATKGSKTGDVWLDYRGNYGQP